MPAVEAAGPTAVTTRMGAEPTVVAAPEAPPREQSPRDLEVGAGEELADALGGMSGDADCDFDEAGGKPSKDGAAPSMERRSEEEASVGGWSLSSECDCAICYRTFCEPVHAGCGRHIFCRQCLWRSEKIGEPLKCPICRRSGTSGAAQLVEVVDLAVKLRTKDPKEYDERAEAARQERERAPIVLRGTTRGEVRALLAELASRPEDVRRFEVQGAGCEESNGVYVVDVLPTYLGPMVYRKPNTFFFIFRWQRSHWVIAELRDYSRMGNNRAWLYSAPTQVPPHLPPATGWEVQQRSGVQAPAPEVRLLTRLTPDLAAAGQGPSMTMIGAAGSDDETTEAGSSPERRGGRSSSEGSPTTGASTGRLSPTSASESVPVPVDPESESLPPQRCKCGPPCSVM